jgi:hypothetical protein
MMAVAMIPLEQAMTGDVLVRYMRAGEMSLSGWTVAHSAVDPETGRRMRVEWRYVTYPGPQLGADARTRCLRGVAAVAPA